jgi:FkbM family methyltransferase
MSLMGRFKNFLFPLRPKPPPEDVATCTKLLELVDLQPGDIAIDCGANVGNITVSMAAAGAEVHAFEPNPYAFRVLERRFARNKNVHCYNQGVHDHDGVMRLYLHENASCDQVYWSTGSSLLDYKGNVNKNSYVEIEVIDLVKFVQDFDKDIKLIKMDVEGVECPIINKMIDTGLIGRIGTLLVETHDDKIPELIPETEALRRRIEATELSQINLNWI